MQIPAYSSTQTTLPIVRISRPTATFSAQQPAPRFSGLFSGISDWWKAKQNRKAEETRVAAEKARVFNEKSQQVLQYLAEFQKQPIQALPNSIDALGHTLNLVKVGEQVFIALRTRSEEVDPSGSPYSQTRTAKGNFEAKSMDGSVALTARYQIMTGPYTDATDYWEITILDKNRNIDLFLYNLSKFNPLSKINPSDGPAPAYTQTVQLISKLNGL